MMEAFARGVTGLALPSGSGVPHDHMYLLEPCSPSVTMVTNPQMKAGAAKVKVTAQLNMVGMECERAVLPCCRCCVYPVVTVMILRVFFFSNESLEAFGFLALLCFLRCVVG